MCLREVFWWTFYMKISIWKDFYRLNRKKEFPNEPSSIYSTEKLNKHISNSSSMQIKDKIWYICRGSQIKKSHK